MKQIEGYWLPDIDQHFEKELRRTGNYQLHHLETALEYVKDFGTAVDGGAHVGLWTVEMAKRFKRVIAFEPAQDCYACLHKNTVGFPNVMVFDLALGDAFHTGLMLSDDPKRTGNTGSRYIGGPKPAHLDPFSMVMLDQQGLLALDFLKLDLEGYEYYALRGATSTILKHRPVVLLEEKDFGRRYELATGAARNLLESWGAEEVAQIGSDHVFVFR